MLGLVASSLTMGLFSLSLLVFISLSRVETTDQGFCFIDGKDEKHATDVFTEFEDLHCKCHSNKKIHWIFNNESLPSVKERNDYDQEGIQHSILTVNNSDKNSGRFCCIAGRYSFCVSVRFYEVAEVAISVITYHKEENNLYQVHLNCTAQLHTEYRQENALLAVMVNKAKPTYDDKKVPLRWRRVGEGKVSLFLTQNFSVSAYSNSSLTCYVQDLAAGGSEPSETVVFHPTSSPPSKSDSYTMNIVSEPNETMVFHLTSSPPSTSDSYTMEIVLLTTISPSVFIIIVAVGYFVKKYQDKSKSQHSTAVGKSPDESETETSGDKERDDSEKNVANKTEDTAAEGHVLMMSSSVECDRTQGNEEFHVTDRPSSEGSTLMYHTQTKPKDTNHTQTVQVMTEMCDTLEDIHSGIRTFLASTECGKTDDI
jgi:hypothetical protein